MYIAPYGDENVKIRRRRQKLFPATSAVSVCLSLRLPAAAATLLRSSALSLFSIAAAAIVLLAKVVRRESDGEMSQKVGKEGERQQPPERGRASGKDGEEERGEGKALVGQISKLAIDLSSRRKKDFQRDRALYKCNFERSVAFSES